MPMLKYSEVVKLKTFDERLDYLKLWNVPHVSPRGISQRLYKNAVWGETRDSIIKRDFGFDLGVFGIYIDGPIYVHHINPITEEDLMEWRPCLLDPENLISTSLNTHNFIHYKPGDTPYVERTPGDTTLW